MAVAGRSPILWTMTDALLRWGDSGATICERQDTGGSAEVPSRDGAGSSLDAAQRSLQVVFGAASFITSGISR